MTPPARKIAAAFAASLDAEDYRRAAALLADDCHYECRGATYRGPSEIIARYRESGDFVRRNLDRYAYESDIIATDGNEVRIRFRDVLQKSEVRFEFECEQVLAIDTTGRIAAIRHIDLLGHTEALARFFRDTGIRP